MKKNIFFDYCAGLLLLVFLGLLIAENFLPLSFEIELALLKILGVTIWFILLCTFLAHSNLKTPAIILLLGLGLFSISLVELINSIQIWSMLLPEAEFLKNPGLITGKTLLALAIFISIYFDRLLKEKYFPSEKALHLFLSLLVALAAILALISSGYNPAKERMMGNNFGQLLPIILDLALIMLFVSIGFEAFHTYRQSQVEHGFWEQKDLFLNQVNWGLLAVNSEQKVIACNSYCIEKIGLNCQPGKYLDESAPELAQHLQTQNKAGSKEIILPTPAGPANLLLEVSPITTPSGECDGHVAIIKDLDEVRKTEMEQISHRLIYECSPAGLIVTDNKDRIFLANMAAEKILGCPLTTSQGKIFKDIADSPIGKIISDLLQDAQKLQKKIILEDYEVATPTGPKILILGIYPIQNIKGKMLGSFCVLIDVTIEKTNERSLRRAEHLAALGELSAAVAHEIRNPLTSIQGFLQLLNKNSASEQQKEYIQIALAELKRANDIISEFLLFARPPKLNLKKQSVVPIIEEVAKVMQAEMALKSTAFALEAEPVPEIGVDRDQLKQIFLNLFQNALQAMGPGGSLTVRVTYDPGSKNVVISVQDTGTGIPEENLSKIFSPFFTTKEAGTGLGLSICNRIVQNHGGKLEVISQVGKGSNFMITLPNVERVC
ncbi:two-component system sensor histidine kinase NtrB [Zhaonella formicivorans]|uniref:two-component system sensor histidine kinase NtrB n=1 Tax=Zhaonella formicivorans TaxID=2528593 RepID=UPI0010DB780F|nr:ATP-binding protein [Zhaonella formicivorans]